MKRRIGILTSGGDCPGLNAAIRGVTRAAYEMLEDMFPDASKIELFARNTRDGWDGFGDELEVSNGTNTR